MLLKECWTYVTVPYTSLYYSCPDINALVKQPFSANSVFMLLEFTGLFILLSLIPYLQKLMLTKAMTGTSLTSMKVCSRSLFLFYFA